MLIKPRRGSLAKMTVRRIAECGDVEAIFLTSGEYGAVASLARGDARKLRRMGVAIGKLLGADVHIVTNHRWYAKRCAVRIFAR